MLWYKAGVQTAECHKAPLRNNREILACIGDSGAQGAFSTDLYVEDLLNPKRTLMASEGDDGTYFSAFDNTTTCGLELGSNEPNTDPVIRARVHKVEFSTSTAHDAPKVLVTASFGKKQMTAKDVKACIGGDKTVLPATASYRLDFRYEGHGYVPVPSSADTVKVFQAR